ncbi:MAG: hypothetical protein R3E31_09460 [Chloroflexota bacterium]
MGTRPPDRQSHYMTVLRQQTVRLAELLEDILSLSRLEMGGEKNKTESG